MQAEVAAAPLGRSKYPRPSSGGEQGGHHQCSWRVCFGSLRAPSDRDFTGQLELFDVGSLVFFFSACKARDPRVRPPPKKATKTSKTGGECPRT
jgi:hypothetical protein